MNNSIDSVIGVEAKTNISNPVFIAMLVVVSIYGFQFFFQEGDSYISPDGWVYLALSKGEHLFVPFNSRVLKCFLAFLFSQTGLSIENSFRLMTPIEVITSLVLIVRMIKRRGGTVMWQVAVVLALGCPLAAFFGHAPILVDTLLLMLTCLMIEALDKRRLGLALLFACLAAATKEYGIFLGLVWGGQAFLRGYRQLAWLGTGLPAAILVVVMLVHPAKTWEMPDGTTNFFWSSIKYVTELPNIVGRNNFPKLIFIWMWFIVWPVFFIALLTLIANLRRRLIEDSAKLNFALILISLPVLLLGDWNRSFLLLVPFACALATSHPLAKDNRFAILLAAGGLFTTLTRPYFYTFTMPYVFNMLMILGSLIVSALIGIKITRFRMQEEAVKVD